MPRLRLGQRLRAAYRAATAPQPALQPRQRAASALAGLPQPGPLEMQCTACPWQVFNFLPEEKPHA